MISAKLVPQGNTEEPILFIIVSTGRVSFYQFVIMNDSMKINYKGTSKVSTFP